MYDPMLMITGVMRVITRFLGEPHTRSTSLTNNSLRDRGAVSIEQVLWYAAAAVSVAVVATIIWNQIRTTASTPVQAPSAP
jgi:hypothetical protein